jgi:tripartite-type tricarboxylate transporter receptor subunit TctC
MAKERSPVLPNLPTTGEQGLDIQAYTWSALFLPKGAPAEVVKKLNEAAVGTLNTPAVAQRLQDQLGVTLPKKEEQTPEWLGQFLVSEIKKWEAPIKASGASAD